MWCLEPDHKFGLGGYVSCSEESAVSPFLTCRWLSYDRLIRGLAAILHIAYPSHPHPSFSSQIPSHLLPTPPSSPCSP